MNRQLQYEAFMASVGVVTPNVLPVMSAIFLLKICFKVP